MHKIIAEKHKFIAEGENVENIQRPSSPRWLRSRRRISASYTTNTNESATSERKKQHLSPAANLQNIQASLQVASINNGQDASLMRHVKRLSERCGFRHAETIQRAFILAIKCKSSLLGKHFVVPSHLLLTSGRTSSASKRNTSKNIGASMVNFQLLLLAVIGLAAKLYEEEPKEPCLVEMVRKSGWTTSFSMKKLILMERNILKLCHYDLLSPCLPN